MRIPYAFHLTSTDSLEIAENEAETGQEIFSYYLAGASLGKVVDMLCAKQIPSPTGKAKWTQVSVDHFLSNSKYIPIVGLESYLSVQFEKAARCNIDSDKAGARRKETCYVSSVMIQT